MFERDEKKSTLLVNKGHYRRFALYKCKLTDCCNFITTLSNSTKQICNSHQKPYVHELKEEFRK
jgi:hypothetical protein